MRSQALWRLAYLCCLPHKYSLLVDDVVKLVRVLVRRVKEVDVHGLDEAVEVLALLVVHRCQVVQDLREVAQQEAPEATDLGRRGRQRRAV